MGNRQGAKAGTRQEFSNQQRIRTSTGKTTQGLDEALSPEHYPDVFQTIGVHGSPYPAPHRQAGGGGIFSNDSRPDVVSSNFQEDLYLTPCLPEEVFSAGIKNHVTDSGSESPHVAYSHRGFHSPSANRRILQPSDSQNRQGKAKEEFTAPEIVSDISSPASFHKRFYQQADVVTGISCGEDSTTLNNTTAHCIDRLENLKRNIEHSNIENLTHFNNTGFAQLHSETDYDDYDNADHSTEPQAWAHRRNKSMSPKTAVAFIQHDTADKSKAVRKLSEPSRAVNRTDSMSSKHTIPEAWSKSAENSPVIVRKALPNPGSPVIVQRTPSQSPSVERRFPANAPSVSVLSGHCVESLDASHTRSQVHHNMLSKAQGSLEAREASFSIREKATAEICLPHAFHSPVSVRKMPESPILRSTIIQHQDKSKEKELSNRIIGDRTMPASLPLEPCMMHYMKVLSSSSSCSSSLSESPNQKPPLQRDSTLPYILPSTSSTSTFPTTSCTTSPTPIQFCPQPKGTPIRTCTMVSQPSTAVILATRESQGSLSAVDVSMESSKEDPKSMGEKRSDQKNVCTDSQGSLASSSPKQTSSSAVTEDSIKEISQTAVFGSVSPKLLRHRRLVRDSSHLDSHSDSQHTFPKHSHSVKITTTKTSPQTGEKTTAGFDEDEILAHLSQSAPSSLSCHGPNSSNCGVGNKTLGQRIREVIFESSAGTESGKEMLSGKYARQFSKDDIFTSTVISEKSSFSPSNHPSKSERFGGDKQLHFRIAHERSIGEERCETNSTVLGTKHIPSSPGTNVPGTCLSKGTGYSDHLKSSRDSCSSCVSDSSQTDTYGNLCSHRHVAELTQANLHHQTELLSAGSHSKHGMAPITRLGVPGQRLVASDTSDTLSTDRDTSSSSKRESSTSTATDDTLMSFRTRSTADSADYDEFVLPATLVFFRSADKDPQHDACGFESEQTTIKRKLPQRQLPGFQAEQEPTYPKTRKKRRKQLYVQSQIVSDTNDLSDSSTLKRHRVVRHVYSDDLSDDSYLFGSKDDISDFPSSRDDISDLPSSRDDISDLPSSRDDISNLPDILQDQSDLPCSKTDTSGTVNTVTAFSDTSPTTNRYVFHRSDLHSPETPSRSILGKSRSRKRNLTADDRTLAKLADTFVKQDFAKRRSSSQDSSDRFLNSYERPGELKESGADVQGPHQWSFTFEKLREPHSDVPSPRSPLRQDQQLPTSPPLRRNPTENTGDRPNCELFRDRNVRPLYADDDDDDDEGKKLLLQRPESENMVVFSCTIYNSACQKRLGSQK